MKNNISIYLLKSLICFIITLNAGCVETCDPISRANLASNITQEALQQINNDAILFDIARKTQICINASDNDERYDKEMLYFPHYKIKYEENRVIINDLCIIETNNKPLTSVGTEWKIMRSEGLFSIIKHQADESFLVQNNYSNKSYYSFMANNDSIYKVLGSHSFKSGYGKTVECYIEDSVYLKMPKECDYSYEYYKRYAFSGLLKLQIKDYDDGTIYSEIKEKSIEVEFQGEKGSF
ncbi:MAG: hypothetical protein Q4F97_10000 [Bacteroidales bacterium]|nr:hypothetical protein [Bacteroidales bacterium]